MMDNYRGEQLVSFEQGCRGNRRDLFGEVWM
jgi:hypothetical protein